MNTIILCPGGKCPIKSQCARFTAERLGRYNSFESEPYNVETRHCDYFRTPFHPTEDEIRLSAYYIWQSRGEVEGESEECWFQACQQLQAPNPDSGYR